MGTTRSLHTVVRTMKVLSMTNIHQCEQAVASLGDYEKTVRDGLHIALRHRPVGALQARASPTGPTGVLVFGSVWGMCGRFNEVLADAVTDALSDHPASHVGLMTFGEYVSGALAHRGWAPEHRETGPESVDGITRRVQEVLVRLNAWRETEGLVRIVLFYNELTSGMQYAVRREQLLPLDPAWLRRIEAEPWSTNQVPAARLGWDDLFASLVQQYVFVSLYRAFAEALASEHSSRLAAMERAEANVEERLERLQSQFHRQRQTAITEEVLDVTAGYTAALERTP